LIESSAKLEESLNKIKIVLKKIKISQMESFKTSEKVSELILKMIESQQETAIIQPPIIIINESVTKTIVMGILVVLFISIACAWCLAPRVILVTTTQIVKLN
jgi:sugar-specific transcriptional regulator TrmB